MAMFGLPVEVLAGAVAGASAAFFTTFEWQTDSWPAKLLLASRLRGVLTCMAAAFVVSATAGPIAALVFEICLYPAVYFKGIKVRRLLAREKAKGDAQEEKARVAIPKFVIKQPVVKQAKVLVS